MGESRIITAKALESADRYSVIIRADGGTGLPCGSSDYSKDAFAKFDGLLIDFNDHHHPLLQKSYRQRQKAYKAAGWVIADMEIAPLDAFMASRPKGVQVAC